MKKLLTLHYRPPELNGRSNSFGQYYFHEVFKKHFQVKGISFGYQKEVFPNFEIILVQDNDIKKLINFMLLGKSPRLTHFHSSDFKKALITKLNEFDPDYIYVEHTLMMKYLENIDTRAKIIFFDDDSILYAKEHRLIGNYYQRFRNINLAKIELKALERADYIINITDQEKLFIEKIGFKNVFSLPYAVDINQFYFNWENPRDKSILFVGNFNHYPNREAIRFVVDNIYPALKNLNWKLRIAGRNIHRLNKKLPKEIEVHENVKDVREFYWKSSLFIAPLFSGAGLRIKILEAAACGVPLIMTPLANLGTNFTDKESTFCYTSEDFIDFFTLQSKNIQQDLISKSRCARKKIEENFSVEIFNQKLESFLELIQSPKN